jgi:outer membrane protein assembly factor BamB
LICILVLAVFVNGQAKPSVEVDVSKCWSYPVPADGGSKLSTDGSRVFIGLEGSKIEALSLDGKKMWSSEFGGSISSNLLATKSGLVVVTSTVSNGEGKQVGSVLRSLSKETGITGWTLKLPDADRHFLYAFEGSVLVVSLSGVIQSLDEKSGSLKWKREIAEGFTASPVFEGGRAAVATAGNQLFVVLLASGQIDSFRKWDLPVTAIGAGSGGELYVGDERGNLSLLLNLSGKVSWKFRAGGEISSVSAAGDHILATSHDNFVYFLGRSRGSVDWKRRLTGRASEVVNFVDRFALIAGSDSSSIVFVDLGSGKVAGQIALGDDENLVHPPMIANGLILILTNEAAYSFSISGCSQTRNDGPGK